MIRDIRYYQNRINLLKGRTGRDNGNIVRKLERKIRNLQKQEMN